MWIKCVIFYLGRVPSIFFFILKHDFHYVGMTDQENNTPGGISLLVIVGCVASMCF